ncbi:MAG: hypothetical protein H7296_03950 [Bacteroidia bacterium]|nr:hypothetical protein [Bacteroidia bacterium]
MKNMFLSFGLLVLCMGPFNATAQIKNKMEAKEFSEFFQQQNCSFETTGKNEYFILEPGYQLVLEGIEDAKQVRLIITVLNETKLIGNVETRIVEENESVNGKTAEISRNYYAFCKQTGSIHYFGEEVDIYNDDGKVVSHNGAWIAEGKNRAGVMMPGLLLLGSRYYQEIAPDIAMNRAEIISTSGIKETTLGKFSHILIIEESTPLEPKRKVYKFYAPGIGLINGGNLLLVKYGPVK